MADGFFSKNIPEVPVRLIKPTRGCHAHSWVIDVCPLCGRRHEHSGGDSLEEAMMGLGSRVRHCPNTDDFEEYYLVQRIKPIYRNVSPSKRFRVLERDGFRCVYCGSTPADGVRLHVDHRIPSSKGGSDNEDNLCTSCDECNFGKGNRLLKVQT